MRRAQLALLLACAVLTMPLAAAERWTYVASPHFELYTTLAEQKARPAIEYFEHIRAFFTEFLKLTPQTTVPTRLIVFDGERQFAAFRPNQAAGAFYQSGFDRDYVVMKALDESSYPIVIHEYAHLIFRHSGAIYPLWLNEGLAEFFSTISPEPRGMSIGKVPVIRALHVSQERLMPLERLFATDHRSPEYNSPAHAGLFYSQSWALTHMLLTHDRYRPRSGEFLRIVATGMPGEAAIATAFERTMTEVMSDLQAYVRRGDYRYFLADYEAPRQAVNSSARVVDDFESELVTTSLLANMVGREAQAREGFERLAGKRPDDLALMEARAFFEMRRGRKNEALRHFSRAVALGSRNPTVYRDYAALDASKAEALLTKAIELSPEDIDLRSRWATVLIGERRAAEAVTTLTTVKRIPQESAFRVFQLLANAYVQLGRIDDGRAAAARAAQYAQPGDEAEFAARLIAQIEEHAARVAGQGSKAVGIAKPASTFVTGQLTNVLSCHTAHPVIELRAPAGMLRLLIDDKDAVVVRGRTGFTIDLACGEHDVPVRVGYIPAADAATRTAGRVRSLDYRQP